MLMENSLLLGKKNIPVILKIVFATQLNEVIIGTSYKPVYTSDKSA